MEGQAGVGRGVTLEEAGERFRAWREQPGRGRRIPKELWDTALSLCKEHAVHKVSRALGIDYGTLKKRFGGTDRCEAGGGFIDLGKVVPQAGVLVECDEGSGRRMRIQCMGQVDGGVVDLVKSFFGRA